MIQLKYTTIHIIEFNATKYQSESPPTASIYLFVVSIPQPSQSMTLNYTHSFVSGTREKNHSEDDMFKSSDDPQVRTTTAVNLKNRIVGRGAEPSKQICYKRRLNVMQFKSFLLAKTQSASASDAFDVCLFLLSLLHSPLL